MIMVMKVRIPFTPRIYDCFFNFLISDWNYSVEDSLFVVDFISCHPGFIVHKAHPCRKNINKFNSWSIYYKPAGMSSFIHIYTGYLLKFIKNDCLPF